MTMAGAGLAMLAIAISGAGGDVRCGDEVMAPGDICTTNPGNVQRSYSEQAEDDRRTAVVFAVGGGALVVGGTAVGVRDHRTQRRGRTPDELHGPPLSA